MRVACSIGPYPDRKKLSVDDKRKDKMEGKKMDIDPAEYAFLNRGQGETYVYKKTGK